MSVAGLLDGVTVRRVAPGELLGPLTPLELRFAPRELWVAGAFRLPLVHPRVAIVGTRSPSDAGRARATELAESLAGAGVTVVSGLARGVDTAVHTGALRSGGPTIAVIGTPLDRAYPAENHELQHRLMREHLVVSQFGEGVPVRPGNFVQRNRTMALIADASIIVESGNTGGSLSQGWETLRLGRPLFIHEAEFQKSHLTWPEEMARYGAVRFREPSDVLDLIPTYSPSLELAALALEAA
jgi:DNA processing protein